MARVTGIGGVFFRANDPEKLQAWYVEHLGLHKDDHGGTSFKWRELDAPDRVGRTVWAPFPHDTDYFGTDVPFMINLRVDDLDGALEQLRAAGAHVDDEVEDYPYGRFAWATDPEGNRLELWEPKGEETLDEPAAEGTETTGATTGATPDETPG